eukprot:1028508-Amphidinium_carterae.4
MKPPSTPYRLILVDSLMSVAMRQGDRDVAKVESHKGSSTGAGDCFSTVLQLQGVFVLLLEGVLVLQDMRVLVLLVLDVLVLLVAIGCDDGVLRTSTHAINNEAMACPSAAIAAEF